MDNRRHLTEATLTETDRQVPGLVERVDTLYEREAEAPWEPHQETAIEARQGWLDRPILVVLVAGLVLAAIFLIATQIWSGADETPTTITDPAAAADNVTPAPVVETPAPAPAAAQ